ncbi:MAG TPA: hypothetical protein VNW04_08070 [Puia sp.]|nr:hypothetical protein [Puia sp.]
MRILQPTLILLCVLALSRPTQGQPRPAVHFWTGTINGKIPVFLWLAEKDSTLQGEVVYTNTKNRTPIKLAGERDNYDQIKVCEFQADGMITGIFFFNKIGATSSGKWYSPSSDKDYVLALNQKDTVLKVDTGFAPEAIAGDYGYQYGKNGPQGSITVHRIRDGRISFDIGCVTSAPAFNQATVGLDTVAIQNDRFTYTLRDSRQCIFQVRFYRDFLIIRYTKGYEGCEGSFGANATVEGVFYRVSGARASTIPFKLTKYNNLSVQGVVNKKDTVHLMFHTAESGLTLTQEAAKRMSSLRFVGADTVHSWGGNGVSQYSKNNSLQIGDLLWDSLLIWVDQNSGQYTDGKFGPDLFAGKIIEINFDDGLIILHPALPSGIGAWQKLKLQAEPGSLYIEATCELNGVAVPNRFLLHSGYAGALLLDDRFVADNHLDSLLKVVGVKELKDSYGHVVKTKKVLLPAFRIGGEELANVPAGFFEGSIGRQKKSVLGGDILKRFNWIIDAKREFIYMRPNHLQSSPYFG